MLKGKSITIETATKGRLQLKHNGLIVATISKKRVKEMVNDLFSSDGLTLQKKKTTKKKKVKKVQSEQEKELLICAKQFARKYRKMKKSFFKVRAVGEIVEGTKAFEHCKEAVKICKRHDVQYEKFIKAQISELNWTGKFPSTNLLATEGAETRLLKYLKEYRGDSGRPVRVLITDEERNTPLNANDKYIAAVGHIKFKTATLEHALYVKEMQLERVGKVSKYVEKYIEKMTR